MNNRTPEVQKWIDIEYHKLQEFDPEIRNGLIVRNYHTSEQRENIEHRIKLYNSACLKFLQFCEREVAHILAEAPSIGTERIYSPSGDLSERELLVA